MTYERNGLLPLLAILVLPFLACLAILTLEPGIERRLLLDGIKVGAILVALGIALSFGASVLAGRANRD